MGLKKKLHFKLKTKLYFISIGMVVLFCAAVLVQFQKGVNEQKQGKIDGFSLYFQNFSSTVSQLFFSKYNNIQAFARNADLKKLNNVGASTFVLNEFVTLFPDMDFLALIDLKGNIVAHNQIDSNGQKLNNDAVKGHNFSNEEWFKSTAAGKYTENINKKIFGAYVTDFHFNDVAEKLYGQKRIGQYYATLIEDEFGDPIAVLATFVNSRWIEHEMSGLYEILASNGMKSAEILMLNKLGKPVSFFGKYGPKNEIQSVHDYDRYNLKKEYFAIKDHAVINQVKNGKSGAALDKDINNASQDHLFAFGPIKNKRFLEELGWSAMVEMEPGDAFSEIYALQKLFYTTLAVVFAICCLVSIFIVQALYKQLLNVIDGLKSSANRTFEFVSQLSEMSGKVNDMSTSQASAIQETASTLDEVSQMVKMSATNAANSVETSSKSEKNANNGKVVVGRVVSAMNDIKGSNEEILNTTSEGNKKISEIVKVINEISEKTKVINDIVFQTKLLSFNASVEAARAGEHGKGFAVVAEEVGNLAQMSGKAAEEISQILGASISRVEGIVKENQSAIEVIMVKSKEKIEEGIEIAGECNGALEDIVEGVKLVSAMSHEISTASREQESGVSNISLAMNQLQDTTNENSNIAYQTLKCSEQLDKETEYLKEVVELLESEVVGGNAVARKNPPMMNNSIKTKENKKEVVKENKKEVVKENKKEVAKENKKEVVKEKDSKTISNENVVSIDKKPEKKTQKNDSKKVDSHLQTAVGGVIPDANDPRFEDV